jgi:hypothetical protein
MYQQYFEYYMKLYSAHLAAPLAPDQLQGLRSTTAAGQALFPPVVFGLPPGLEDLGRPIRMPAPANQHAPNATSLATATAEEAPSGV